MKKALTSLEMSSFESWSLSLPDSPPHHFQTCPMALLTCFHTTGTEGFPYWLWGNFEEERWVSLCFSQSRTIGAWKLRPWGCCRQAHSLTFLWWVHRVEPGVLSAHARMYWPPNWPPASTPPTGLWLALYQTAVLGATGGRPRLCPGQQLHWPDSAWQDGPHGPLPSAPITPWARSLRSWGEGKPKLTLKNCFCGPKASKKHTILFPFLQYHQFWHLVFNHSNWSDKNE